MSNRIRERRLRRMRHLATVLDSAVRVPGTRITFGLDALLGLLPGVGDVAGGVASGYILVEAARTGASKPVLVRMLGNILVELVVGAIPFLGDLFDVAWRANRRNVALLEHHLEGRPDADGRDLRRVGLLFLTGMLGILLLVILGVLWLMVALVRAF